MDLATLISEVIGETNRADLQDVAGINVIQNAVLASTLYLHTQEFFYKDIKPTQVVFENASYIQTLDTRVMPRFRSISYFRKYAPSLVSYQLDPNLLPPLYDPFTRALVQSEFLFMKIIDPTDILDSYNTEKFNVAYQAGATIFAKSNTALQYALMGFYQYPDTNPATFNSWIAEELPYCIIYAAAYNILRKSGNLDAATGYVSSDGQKGLAIEQKRILNMNNIVAEGY